MYQVDAIQQEKIGAMIIDGLLYPGISLNNERILPNASKVYELRDLVPGQSYEVKLSYSAAFPTIFTFAWEEENTKDNVSFFEGQNEKNTILRRRRLNTEKVLFYHAQFDQKKLLRLDAKPEGISPFVDVNTRSTSFNIVLEEIYFGIPRSAFKLIIVALMYVTLTIGCFLPFLRRYIIKNFQINDST